MGNNMYSVEDVRKSLGCSKDKVYQIIHSVGFPKIKIGRQFYIPIDEYNKWIENHMNLSIIL